MKNKWVIGVVGIALAIAIGVMSTRARPANDHAVILSDGTSLKLLTVTSGTNHQVGLRFAHLLKLLPTQAAESVQGWFGNQYLGKSLQTSETNLVVWIEQAGSSWGTRVSRSIMLKAPGGPNSGEEKHNGFHLTNGQSNQLHSIRFRNWPRREEWIECVIFERDEQHENEQIGSFKFKNPMTINRPSWSPEQASKVQYAGDLKVTLQDFAAGISNSQTSRKNSDGVR
ncbi:MAG: hypothetical protein HOI66_06275 [Verrucomicrobia bacterium]|jgi:hypothetical protein|nr:hypothetical protein [Verrucomicrobiota bacterium]